MTGGGRYPSYYRTTLLMSQPAHTAAVRQTAAVSVDRLFHMRERERRRRRWRGGCGRERMLVAATPHIFTHARACVCDAYCGNAATMFCTYEGREVGFTRDASQREAKGT